MTKEALELGNELQNRIGLISNWIKALDRNADSFGVDTYTGVFQLKINGEDIMEEIRLEEIGADALKKIINEVRQNYIAQIYELTAEFEKL